MNFLGSIFNTYLEPRRFINKRTANGVNERELLAIAFGVALLSFASNSIDLSFSQKTEISKEVFARLLSSHFAVAIFFVPLFLYFLAAIFHGILRVFYNLTRMPFSRLTLFWSLFLCMPIQIFVSILSVAFINERLSILLNLIILAYFIWLWSIFDTEIFGMKKILPVFGLKLGIIAFCFFTVLVL